MPSEPSPAAISEPRTKSRTSSSFAFEKPRGTLEDVRELSTSAIDITTAGSTATASNVDSRIKAASSVSFKPEALPTLRSDVERAELSSSAIDITTATATAKTNDIDNRTKAASSVSFKPGALPTLRSEFERAESFLAEVSAAPNPQAPSTAGEKVRQIRERAVAPIFVLLNFLYCNFSLLLVPLNVWQLGDQVSQCIYHQHFVNIVFAFCILNGDCSCSVCALFMLVAPCY
jgi:hypothetical protein